MDWSITESLGTLEEIFRKGSFPGERSLFEDTGRQAYIGGQARKLLCTFRAVLESLVKLGMPPFRVAWSLLKTGGGSAGGSGEGRPKTLAVGGGARASGRREGGGVKDKRVLVVLNNAHYFRRFSLPLLCDRLASIGVQGGARLVLGSA